MLALQEQEQSTVPDYVAQAHNFDARRFMWSGSLKEELPKGCGHQFIERRRLLVVDTYSAVIPFEEPARNMNADGSEEELDSPFGTRFLVINQPPPAGAAPGTRGFRGTGLRKTAAQIVHDIDYTMNAVGEPRGIGEIVCLRGKFEDKAGLAELTKLENTILPAEYRTTLRKTVEWLGGSGVQKAIDTLPVAQRELAEEMRGEMWALASVAEFYITNRIDNAENEVAARKAGAKIGQKALTAFDFDCLRELERVEATQLPAKQGLDSTMALGRELASSITDGFASALNGRDDSATKLNQELADRLAALEAKLGEDAKPKTAKPAKE